MTSCRICNFKLIKIIDFGKIALVGNFLKRKNQRKYKISLNYCQSCKHVQISEHLKPDLLFKNYLWETGVSKSNFYLLNDLIKRLKKSGISKNSKILEIASNDGSFIKILKKQFKSFVLGIDPAQNLAKKANSEKVFTINKFFDFNLSKKIQKKFGKFDFVFARNVVAHLNNPNEIFKGVENLLSGDGIFILEVPHLLNIIKQNQYDNIFHEHIGFHSLKSINDLCKRNKLQVLDVDLINSQGGSIRCFISKSKIENKISKKVDNILNIEKKSKLFSNKELEKFEIKIKKHIKDFKAMIKKLKKNKKKISIYGASGKGQAFMQFNKINNKIIDYVFDKSKLKQGKLTPGTNIEILNPKLLTRQKVDYLLILSWNIKEEIIKQETNFRKNGGKFIIPFPRPKVLN